MRQIKIFMGLVHSQTITKRGSVEHIPMTLDEDINTYIADDLAAIGAKVVDIKLSTIQDQDHGDIVGTALLIYEEPDAEEVE